MIAHSWADLAGKGLSAVLILGVLYFASDSPDGYRAFDDELSITKTVLYAALLGFGLVFAINLLFVAPYQLYQNASIALDEKMKFQVDEIAFDVHQWDDVNCLQLFQAASLWAEVSPPMSPDAMHHKALPILQKLKFGVINSELALFDDLDNKKRQWLLMVPAVSFGMNSKAIEIPDTTETDRQSLIKFAEKINERPRFLFGDDV
ncbi:hypothetical protein [Sphingorhabdus sp. 109]|jgi:hypothetical protein|uniref:hypothetical protein n=1 Tax=Sphingorhabdus sp. 109 TaxID=2653173 RepID=UPI0013580879|nr:hypothetical protein [Sphingorhabdus sp. 109]